MFNADGNWVNCGEPTAALTLGITNGAVAAILVCLLVLLSKCAFYSSYETGGNRHVCDLALHGLFSFSPGPAVGRLLEATSCNPRTISIF